MELEKARSRAVPPMGEPSGSDFGMHVGPLMSPKSVKNQVQTMLRMEKVELGIFDTPPLRNHYFWVPMDVKMEPQ